MLAALALLAALGVPPAPTAVQAVSPADPKARAVVDASLAAMGGDAYLRAKYRSGSGHIYTFQSSGVLADAGTPFWSYARFPDAERIELTKQRNVVEIFAGDKGWEITFHGVASVPAAALASHIELRNHSLDTILRTWSRDPATTMIYLGLNQVNQAPVETVQLVNAAGLSATVDFGQSDHLPVRVSWRHDDAQTGGHFDQILIYGTWTRIAGIATPFLLEYWQGTRRMQQTFYDTAGYAPFLDSLLQPAALKH